MNIKKYVQFLENHKIISARHIPEGAIVVSVTKNWSYPMEAERYHIHLFSFEGRARKNPLPNPEVIKTNMLKDELIVELFKFYEI